MKRRWEQLEILDFQRSLSSQISWHSHNSVIGGPQDTSSSSDWDSGSSQIERSQRRDSDRLNTWTLELGWVVVSSPDKKDLVTVSWAGEHKMIALVDRYE